MITILIEWMDERLAKRTGEVYLVGWGKGDGGVLVMETFLGWTVYLN